MREFNVPIQNTPANTPDSSGPAGQGGGIVDINERVQQVFGDAAPAPSPQPSPQAQSQPAAPPQNPPAPQQPPKPGQQPPAPSPQPSPQAEIDPVKVFAEASPKAFFTQTGDLDSAKINDFFLTNGKSFMKFADAPPVETSAPATPTDRPDPLKEYNEKLSWMAEHMGEEVAGRIKEGATHEQVMQEVQEYYAGLRTELKTRLDLRKAIEEETKKLAPELESARQDRINAAINRNIYELSQNCEGLVTGLTGAQVLNQFLLDPKYGGNEIDRQFLREHPEAKKLDLKKPEDAAKHAELSQKWFKDFQQDRRAMAHVAEFGRLRWMFAECLKPMLEHAQKVGAQKVANASEAAIGAPSRIANPPSPGKKDDFDTFFGLDAVN